MICELDEVGWVYRGMCVVFHSPPQDADDTLSVEELGLEDGLVDMELLGSQGAESWKDTITRGDNGLASQYTSSVTTHTKSLSLPACHILHLRWLYLYSFPPLPLCPLPLHSSILLHPSPVPPFWSSTLPSAPPPALPLPQTPSLQLCCCRLPCQFQDTPQTVTATQEICCECSQLLVCVCVR